MTTTEKLLNELNDKKGLSYPDISYSYFADIRGDGQNIRSVYTIINENGGVCYNRALNGKHARERCDNIRRAQLEATHPIRHDDGSIDYRYKICAQFTGRENKSFITVFCNEQFGEYHDTHVQALKALIEYYNS